MYDDDEDYEDGIDNLSGGDLVKALRKQLKDANKRLKEQEQAMQQFQQMQHAMTVEQMLAEYGLNTRIAAFVPDSVSSHEELEAWLDEYGEVFGVVAVQDDYESDPDAQAHELMSSVEDDGYDPEVGYDVFSQMENASSPEEILRIARSIGD